MRLLRVVLPCDEPGSVGPGTIARSSSVSVARRRSVSPWGERPGAFARSRCAREVDPECRGLLERPSPVPSSFGRPSARPRSTSRPHRASSRERPTPATTDCPRSKQYSTIARTSCSPKAATTTRRQARRCDRGQELAQRTAVERDGTRMRGHYAARSAPLKYRFEHW
jgi:hypothetical protein